MTRKKLSDLARALLTSAVCLLPILPGLLLLPALPEQVATHFGASGEPDGWMPKLQAVVMIPAFMALVNLFCHAALHFDPRRQGQSSALRTVALWFCPVLCVVLQAATLVYALGVPVPIALVCCVTVGVLFVIIGNYLPKCRLNYTMGIRTPWTLSSEENWNRTHRLGGKLWVAAGILITASGFLPLGPKEGGEIAFVLMLIAVALASLIPVGYSLWLYQKEKKSEKKD